MKKRIFVSGMMLVAAIGIVTARDVGEPRFDHATLKPLTEQDRSAGLVPNAPAAGPAIVASIYYRSSENPNEYGMYTIDASNGYIEELSLHDHIQALGGGYYDNGIYRFVGSVNNSDSYSYYEYDVTDWSMAGHEYLPDLTNTALDVAFDPETGYVYGCFCDAIGSKFMFGYIDYDTHTSVPLADCGTLLYFGMAVTPDGQLYGIASDGYLYRIDKTSGAKEKVGPLGFRPKYNQTAVCDLQTGKVYWLGCSVDGATGLYELNVQTGAARIIRSFQNRDGAVGAFIAQSPWKPAAPEAVTELKTGLDGSATDGNIYFRMPQTTIGGAVLSGEHSYKVFVNGKLLASGKAMPDALVTLPASFTAGVLDVRVSVSNDAGAGRVARLRSYAGFDAPAAVKNLATTVSGGNTVKLSWDTPQEGMNGGYLDNSGISYRILRYPGALTISSGLKKNEFTQRLSDNKYAVYRYEIIPQSHGNAGPSAMSEYVAVGPEIPLPWTSVFDSDGAMTMVAENRSVYGWNHNRTENMFEYTGGEHSLFTPAFMLDADHAYRLVLNAAESSGVAVPLAVSCGKAISHSASAGEQFGQISVQGSEYADYECYIYTADTGRMFLSVAASMPEGAAALSLKSMRLEEGPSALAPRAVTDITVTPDPEGQNKAEISFILPTQAINGSRLQSIDHVAVYRNGEFIANAAIEPGATQGVYVDSDVWGGETLYELRAVNSAGEGLPCKAGAYVGVDVPMPPADVKAEYYDGKVRISWTAPTLGANGGYIDPANLSYLVINSQKAQIAVTEGTTLCIDETDYSGPQQMMQYGVLAASETGDSQMAVSNTVVVGTPYLAPFHETFRNGGLDNRYWETGGVGLRYFTLSAVSGCDGEPGCATYKPQAAKDAVESSLMSGKIDISQMDAPVLEYNYTSEAGAATVLSVLAMLPDGSEAELDRVDFRTLGIEDGWHSRKVSLREHQNQPFIRIRLRVCSEDGRTGSSIDNVMIEDGYEKDLAVTLEPVSSIASGQTHSLGVHVDNFGYADVVAGSYEVTLFKNGKAVAATSDVPALKPFEGTDLELELPATVFDPTTIDVYAQVNLPGDANEDNNSSNHLTVTVKRSQLPEPTALTGTMAEDGRVELSWTAPDTRDMGNVYTDDDLESYKPFAIKNVGEWTMIDGDGVNTYGISDGAGSYRNFPNALDPKAFIVFNAPQSGVNYQSPDGSAIKWAPHSGNQMFISFQASGAMSDDWLISPRLSGAAQTISYYCRSVDISTKGPESYELYYSTDGIEPQDFIQLLADDRVPGEWTRVEADLPEGARYFAIHCISAGRFAFMLDDFRFSVENLEGAVLQGYNVYRNGVLVTDMPVDKCQYSEQLTAAGADYNVTAVYDMGESLPSETLVVGTGSANGPVQADSISITADGGMLLISGARGLAGSVCTVDGSVIYSSDSMPQVVSLRPAPGIYVVRAGSKVEKIILK